MSILIRSKARSFTVKVGDPLYRTFLSSLEEATGALPDVVELPDYILVQRYAWEDLMRWIELGTDVFYMGEDTDTWVELETLRNITPPTVYLADVAAFIGTLVDMPVGWERFVAVDERTLPSERADHYRKVGAMVRRGERIEYHRECTISLHGDLGLLNDPIHCTEDIEMREALLAIEDLNALQGIRHNTLLKLIGSGKWRVIQEREIDWRLIPWNDVLKYGTYDWTKLSRNDSSGALTIPHSVPLFVYCLAGVSIPTSIPLRLTLPIPFHTAFQLDPIGTLVYQLGNGQLSVEIEGLNELYDRTLIAVGGRLSSAQLGLTSLLAPDNTVIEPTLPVEIPGRTGYYHTDIVGLFSVINTFYLKKRRGPMREDLELPVIIDDIVHTLGLSALSTFVTSLLEDSSEDIGALSFCHAAVEVLEGLGTEGGSHLS